VKLSRLSVTGPGKAEARIDFGPGLTLITGASNTGKTHIRECVNFALGSDSEPERIPEREGYNTVSLELLSGDDTFVISRTLEDPDDALVFSGTLEEVNAVDAEVIPVSIGNVDEVSESLSGWLLQKSGFDSQMRLIKNQSADSQRISFRTFAPLSLVDEVSMIAKKSPATPIGTANPNPLRSVFRISATGRGPYATDLAQIRKTNDQREMALQREAVISPMVSSLESELRDAPLGRETLASELEKIEVELAEISERVSKSGDRARALIDERNRLVTEADSHSRNVTDQSELIERFKLLSQHYDVDVRRLEFVAEGGHFFDQIAASHCPTCGQEIPDGSTCHPEVTDPVKVESAARKEIKKLLPRIEDLQKAIGEAESRREQSAKDQKRLANQIEELEREIQDVANPTAEEAKSRVEKITSRRRELEELSLKYRELDRYIELQTKAAAISRQPKAKYIRDKDEELLNAFAERVGSLLKDWQFPLKIGVRFEMQKDDILIDGVRRTTNGKGVRAVTHAAFTVGLMAHCLANETPHSGFVLLDTPLTPFRGMIETEEDPEMKRSVREACLRSLASRDDLGQSIVIENVNPPTGLDESAVIHEFVGAGGEGREGFYP